MQGSIRRECSKKKLGLGSDSDCPFKVTDSNLKGRGRGLGLGSQYARKKISDYFFG